MLHKLKSAANIAKIKLRRSVEGAAWASRVYRPRPWQTAKVDFTFWMLLMAGAFVVLALISMRYAIAQTVHSKQPYVWRSTGISGSRKARWRRRSVLVAAAAAHGRGRGRAFFQDPPQVQPFDAQLEVEGADIAEGLLSGEAYLRLVQTRGGWGSELCLSAVSGRSEQSSLGECRSVVWAAAPNRDCIPLRWQLYLPAVRDYERGNVRRNAKGESTVISTDEADSIPQGGRQ